MMRLIYGLITITLSLCSVSLPASDWEYQLTPYIWMPNFSANMDGDDSFPPSEGGGLKSETTLDSAFLIYTAASKDRHSFSFEFDWVDVTTDAESGLLFYEDAEVNWELLVYSFGYRYRVLDGRLKHDGLELGLGLRHWDLDVSGELLSDTLPPIKTGFNLTWNDGYIDLRGRQSITSNGNWFVSGMLLTGCGDSDLMLDAGGSIGYQWSKDFNTSLGYRYLEVEYEDLQLTQQGMIAFFDFRI